MDPLESYLPIYDVNRVLRFSTGVNFNEWTSLGGPPRVELELVNPSSRFSLTADDIAALIAAWNGNERPWAGFSPTSALCVGEDPVGWLLPGVPDGAIVQSGRHFVVNENWKAQANLIAPRIAAACSLIVEILPTVFERHVHGRVIPCHPSPYTEGSLENLDFDSETNGRRYLAALAHEIVDNMGFLGWFMACVPGWEKLVSEEVSGFVKGLRLKDRERRGFFFDPVLDWPSLDIPWLCANNVPIHYIWTEEAERHTRLIQLNPAYLKHHRRVTLRLGRSPTWNEFMKDHDDWQYVCLADRYLQEPGEAPSVPPSKNVEDRPYFMRAHEHWYPHRIENLGTVRKALDRGCGASVPQYGERAEGPLPIWIQGWTGGTIFQDVRLRDRLEFYGLPPVLQEGGEVNCRELKKIACAPSPEEMRLAGELERLQARLDNVQALSAEEDERHRQSRLAQRGALERISSGYQERALPARSRTKPPLASRLSSPKPPRGGPLAARIGPPAGDLAEEALQASTSALPPIASEKPTEEELPDDAMDWEAENGCAWTEGGFSSTLDPPSVHDEPVRAPAPRNGESPRRARPSRLPEPARGSAQAIRRRSESPPRVRLPRPPRAPVPSSSPTSNQLAVLRPIEPNEEGIIIVPNPSARFRKITRFNAAEWKLGLRQLGYELAGLQKKASPVRSVPEVRQKISTIRWAPNVTRHAYIGVTTPEDEVRLWAWGADAEAHPTPTNLINRYLTAARPMKLGFPTSMLSAKAPPGAHLPTHSHSNPRLILTGESYDELAESYLEGLRQLAKKPHAGSFIFLGGAANFVVRQFMWDAVVDRIGQGPCQETTQLQKGKRGYPGDGVTVYYDYASEPERDFILGTVYLPGGGDNDPGTRSYFPPNRVWFKDDRDWYGEWTEFDEELCLSIAVAIKNGTAVPKTAGDWGRYFSRDRIRVVQNKNLYHLFRNKLSVRDAIAWANYLKEAHGLESGEYRRVRTLLDTLEPRFLLVE